MAGVALGNTPFVESPAAFTDGCNMLWKKLRVHIFHQRPWHFNSVTVNCHIEKHGWPLKIRGFLHRGSSCYTDQGGIPSPKPCPWPTFSSDGRPASQHPWSTKFVWTDLTEYVCHWLNLCVGLYTFCTHFGSQFGALSILFLLEAILCIMAWTSSAKHKNM